MASTLIGLSSCTSSKNAVKLSSLAGEWNMIEINGAVVVPAPGETFPFIAFNADNGTVYGNAGCNSLTGSFDANAKPGTIDLGALGSTRRLCPDMTTERNVLSALAQVKKYKSLDGGNMALCNGSGRPVIVLQHRQPTVSLQDLSGKWFIAQAGGVDVPEGMETRPFIEFDTAKQSLHGNAGCNLINGSFVSNGQTPTAIAFPQVASTMMSCPDMEVETRILKALNEIRSFGKLAGGDMGFYDGNGTLVLTIRK